MTGLQHLRELDIDRSRVTHPALPESARVAHKFNDSTANGLTKAIVRYIDLIGGWGTRVTSSGRMLPTRVTEVKTELKYIPGNTKKGTPDIMGTYNGISLFIEVKIGKDKQSDAQKAVEIEVNKSGGKYFIAKNFQSFYEWINKL